MPRYYRPPEIILGCEYSYPLDMWSLACTLFELYSGCVLFTGTTSDEVLK